MTCQIKNINSLQQEIRELEIELRKLKDEFVVTDQDYNELKNRFNDAGLLKKDDSAYNYYHEYSGTEQQVLNIKERDELYRKRKVIRETEQGCLNAQELERLQELEWMTNPHEKASELFRKTHWQHDDLKKKISEKEKKISQMHNSLSDLKKEQECYNNKLLEEFKKAYKKRCLEDARGFFGFFRRSRIDLTDLTFHTLVHHAFKNGGNRTRDILVNELKWFNKDGTSSFEDINDILQEETAKTTTIIASPHQHFKEIVKSVESDELAEPMPKNM